MKLIFIIFIIFLYSIQMCQCVLCDCLWLNYCGILNAGWYVAVELVSCWACQPQEIKNTDDDCVRWGCEGCGSNFFCSGCVICATAYLKDYSHIKTQQGN
jgi:hypothetical protein